MAAGAVCRKPVSDDLSSEHIALSLQHSQLREFPILEARVRQVTPNNERNLFFAQLLLRDVEGVPVTQVLYVSMAVTVVCVEIQRRVL